MRRAPLIISTLAICLAGCGGDGATTTAALGEQAAFREAQLEFARCMREEGIDFPDPQEATAGGGEGGRSGGRSGSGPLVVRPGEGSDPEELRAADEKCRKHLVDLRPPELSEEQQREFRDAALRHARCMREHGVDFPDPQFGEGGKAQVRIGEGLDPDDPALRRAQEACRDEMERQAP